MGAGIVSVTNFELNFIVLTYFQKHILLLVHTNTFFRPLKVRHRSQKLTLMKTLTRLLMMKVLTTVRQAQTAAQGRNIRSTTLGEATGSHRQLYVFQSLPV